MLISIASTTTTATSVEGGPASGVAASPHRATPTACCGFGWACANLGENPRHERRPERPTGPRSGEADARSCPAVQKRLWWLWWLWFRRVLDVIRVYQDITTDAAN